MNKVRNVQEIFETLQDIKRRSTRYLTNFFPNHSKLELWINQQKLFLFRTEEACLVLRKHSSFFYMYFVASEVSSLSDILQKNKFLKENRVVVELVGKIPDTDYLKQILKINGFAEHFTLNRMQKIHAEKNLKLSEHTQFAKEGEEESICRLLEENFDKYGEQIPELSEVASAIKNQNILVYRQKQEIIGLLFFEIVGFNSNLRYWLVTKGFHNMGIGSHLMRHYFYQARHVKRSTLWVRSNNWNAIDKYKYYGYALDGVCDMVMIHRESEET